MGPSPSCVHNTPTQEALSLLGIAISRADKPMFHWLAYELELLEEKWATQPANTKEGKTPPQRFKVQGGGVGLRLERGEGARVHARMHACMQAGRHTHACMQVHAQHMHAGTHAVCHAAFTRCYYPSMYGPTRCSQAHAHALSIHTAGPGPCHPHCVPRAAGRLCAHAG